MLPPANSVLTGRGLRFATVRVPWTEFGLRMRVRKSMALGEGRQDGVLVVDEPAF